MISDVDVSLFIWAALVALISTVPRGRLWIGIAALSYISATIAWRTNLPYAEAITGMGDAAVCLAVYFRGREAWEMWVWRLYQTSVGISMLFLADNLGLLQIDLFGLALRMDISHETYSIMLEAVNWLLLLLIGSMSIGQRFGARYVSARRPWHRVRRFALSLREKRARAPFYQVR